jgi:hypothetical protein
VNELVIAEINPDMGKRAIEGVEENQISWLQILFVDRLAATPEGDGNLLDNCMVMYGCGIADGNRHNHEDLPIIMAGRAGGAIDTGRLVAAPRETPLCNLYVSMLERSGCDVGSFGDSTGNLQGLLA